MPINLTRALSAPASEVYRAFTSATALRDWLCNAATVDAVKGGRVYLWWNDGYYTSGEYTALASNKRIAFTWRGKREKESRVVVSLAEKNGATQVTVTHNHPQAKQFAKSWRFSLENLQALLETGQDLRFTRRPLLGVNIGDFDATVAAKIGVPVTAGIRLDNTAAGLGAHAAGLRANDVIVKLGGRKVKHWTSMLRALEPHRAGDVVKVDFYRGAEKKSAQMKLSQRPLPDVPTTARGLADALAKIYRELDAELEKCFAGVSDADASRKPAADEWSAKETLAHFIATERGAHEWIADLLNGEERVQDNPANPTNLAPRIQATVQAYPTAGELLAEFKRNQQETLALIAALPPESVARKASFWKLGYSLLSYTDHNQTHVEQIRRAAVGSQQ